MSDSIDPYLVEIGSFTLNSPMEFRESSVHGSSFKAYVFGPGAYPLYAQIVGNQVSLVSPPAVAVVYACDNPHEIGTSKQARIPVSQQEVEAGLVSLDISSKYKSAFSVSDNNPYGLKSFVGNKEDSVWQELSEEATRHYFCSDLFEYNQGLRAYAQENGFLEGRKLSIGQNMGARYYEWVIRADIVFRKKTGHGLDHFSIPLHEVADRFREKQGSAIDMSKAVAKEIIKDCDIPEKPEQAFGSEVSNS